MSKTKKTKVKVLRPSRDPDYHSKRNVPYWWAPEWIRGTSGDQIDIGDFAKHVEKEIAKGNNPGNRWQKNAAGEWVGSCESYGKIKAVKEKNGEVSLYMKNNKGELTYIQGSIQQEFRKWHTDRSIDYILFGLPIDEIIDDET